MKIRVIPTNVHGAIDYVTAPALVAAPDVLRLNGGRASSAAPRVAGATAALYSALTDYELGLRRVIPMRVHLLLDAVGGSALAAAPWLFRSAGRGVRHWLPHALVGGGEVVGAAGPVVVVAGPTVAVVEGPVVVVGVAGEVVVVVAGRVVVVVAGEVVVVVAGEVVVVVGIVVGVVD